MLRMLQIVSLVGYYSNAKDMLQIVSLVGYYSNAKDMLQLGHMYTNN